jgi:hypothetical protein
MKRSSYGAWKQGHYAQEFYTTVKTIYGVVLQLAAARPDARGNSYRNWPAPNA